MSTDAPKVEQVALADIRTDGGTQARAKLDDATVEEYAAALPADLASHPHWGGSCFVADRMEFAFVRRDGDGWSIRVLHAGGDASATRNPVRESFVGLQLAALGFDPRGASWVKLEPRHAKHGDSRVYFAQSDAGGPIKIGHSHSPEARVASLECGSPFPLRILKTIPGGAKAERALHDRFAMHRLRGEWFAPHPDLLAFIAEAS